MIRKLLEIDKSLSESIYKRSENRSLYSKLLYRLTFGYGVLPLIFVVIILSNNITQVILALGLMVIVFFIGFENYLKRLLKRKRPSYSILKSYSFPSTHALSTMVITVFIIFTTNYLNGYLILLIFVYDLLIGVSRVYLGFHYVSDILGGWAIGFVFGLIFTTIYIQLII